MDYFSYIYDLIFRLIQLAETVRRIATRVLIVYKGEDITVLNVLAGGSLFVILVLIIIKLFPIL